jgi:hypothetical protein
MEEATKSSFSFSHSMWAVFGGLHAIVAVGACVRLVAKITLKAKRLILALHLLIFVFCALISSVCFGFFFFDSTHADTLKVVLVWSWSYPLADLLYMLIALSWSDIVKVCASFMQKSVHSLLYMLNVSSFPRVLLP